MFGTFSKVNAKLLKVIPLTPLVQKVGLRHEAFVSRTVFVRNNDVQGACRTVNRILGKEGFLDQYRKTRYFERPTQKKRRVNFERAKAFYNEDMARKIEFTLRKNRAEAYPGC